MARIPSFLRGRKGGGDYKNTPDTIRSEDTVEVILGVGEGDNFGLAEGAKSFLMGGTALVNSNNEANFGDFQLVEYTGQSNPPAIVPYLGGFGSPKPANASSLAQNVPVIRTGELTQIDYIDLRFLISQLVKSNDKGTYTADLQLRVEYRKSQPAGSPWVPAWSENIVPPGYDENTGQSGVNVYSYGTDAQDYKARLVTFEGDDVYLRNDPSPGAPTGDFPNVWVDPSTGRPSTYNNGVWTPVGTNTGDSWTYGTTKFYKNPQTPPPNPNVGDVWTPPNGSAPLKFNGSSWVLSLIGASINSKYAQPLLGNANGILSIQQKITSPVVREVRVPVPRANVPYDLRITKITPDTDSEGKYVSEVGWESFEEIVAEGRSFPNTHILHLIGTASDQFTQLPELLGDVKGRLIDVPTNYDPVTRTYTGVWDGLFKKAWTDNGAWATRDFIKNDRYGLSALYPLEVREASFYNWAVWCDQVVPDNVGGTRPRWTYNDDLSEPRQAKAQGEYMAGSCGGKLIDDGSGVYDVLVDRDEPMTMIFGPENIANDGEITYSFSDEQTRANWIKVGFINPEKDWAVDYRIVKDDAHIAEYGRIPMEFVATGKTNLSEALAAARLRLITGTTEYTAATWRTNRVGKYLFPFKVVGLCDPDMGWGISGRASEVTGARQIRLRDPIYLEAGLTHKFTFNLPTSPITTATVTVAPGQSGSLTVINFTSDLPALPEFPQFSVSTFNGDTPIATPKAFKILTITPADGDSEIVEITALELNRNKWAFVDGTGELLPAEEYTNFDQPLVSPQNVKLSPYIATAGGITRRSLQIQWDRPTNPFGRNTLIEYSNDGGEFTQIAESNTEYYELKDLVVGTHAIRLTHVHVDGVHKSRPVVVVHEIGEVRNVPPVANVRLADEAQPNIYESISPMFRWDHGDEDPNFRTYRVRVQHPVNNDVVRTVDVPLREFIYEFDKNTADFLGTPSRAFKVSITKVDDYGNESIPALLSVSNPSPQAPAVMVEGTNGGVNVVLAPSTQRDVVGAIVQVDTADTPLEQVFDVDQGAVFIPLSDFQPRLIRGAYYDSFGKTGLNWSQSQEVSKQSIPMEDVQDLLDKLTTVDQLLADNKAAIEELEDVYGDTASSAANAAAAAASASNAAGSAATAEIAKGQAQSSAQTALAQAQAAAGSATASEASKVAAATSATAANTAKTASETAATTANAAKTAAETARTQAQAAKAAAETAQADAIAKATAAGQSATAAAGSATTATNQANAAAGSASAAAASATAASTSSGNASASATQAATSASNALGSQNAAAASATVAASARDAASLSAAALWPERYDSTGQSYFTSSVTGNPTSVPLRPSNINIEGFGPAVRLTPLAGSVIDFTHRMVLPATSGRIYRVECELQRQSVTGTGNGLASVQLRTLDSSYAGLGVSGAYIQLNGDVQVFSAMFADATTAAGKAGVTAWPAGTVWLRPYARLERGSNVTDVTADFRRLKVTDVTEAYQAQQSATASATSAASAAASQTAAGQSASAAATSATQANTARGEAQTFRNEAATSATNAAGSATTAATQAGIATSAKDAAAGSATAAGNSATAAASSATAAGNSATASQASRVAAETARDAAAGSATAAAGSASSAATSSTSAGNSASAAAASSVSASTSASNALLSASALWPERYDGQSYFTSTAAGDPATRTLLASNAVAEGFGPVCSITTGGSGDFAHRMALPATPGRIYRVEAEFQRTDFTAPRGGQIRIGLRGMDASYNQLVATSAFSGPTQLNGEVQTASAMFADAATAAGKTDVTAWQGGAVWLRPHARFEVSGSGSTTVTTQFRRLKVTDITESYAAQASATAAATSASSAAASETAAGQSASAANQSKLDAQTAQAAASNSATGAANSATSAAGSAATATTQAGLAATARDAAAGSATAANTSAGNAAASATAAGNSATASQASSVTASTAATSAQTAASRTLPSTFEDGSTYFTTGDTGNTWTGFTLIDTDKGKAWQLTGPTFRQMRQKGSLPAQVGRTYRATAIVRNTTADATVRPWVRLVMFNAAGAKTDGPGTYASGGTDWETITSTFKVTNAAHVAIRAEAILNYKGGATNNTVDVGGTIALLLIEDITSQQAAADSATAAATSASSASASQTAAGQSASAAANSATAANTSAGNASTSASQASTSATNAAGSASTAATAATNAANSRDAAAGSASAAAGSASTASTKAGEASTSATAAAASQVSASTSAGAALLSAASLWPERYDGQSYFVTGGQVTGGGNPATVPLAPSTDTVAGFGPVRRVVIPSAQADFGHRMVLPATPGRIYRVEAEVQRQEVSGTGTGRIRVELRRLNASYVSIGGAGGPNVNLTGDVQVISAMFSDPATAAGKSGVYAWGSDDVWLRPYVRAEPVTSGTSITVDFRRLKVTDVTEAYQAQASASAAATSASNASASQTAAGQSATAAAGSATTANTAAGQASTFATQASNSATNAAGSASSASTSAGTAATARDQANAASSSAQASAATATTQASNAAGSAAAASISASLSAKSGVQNEWTNGDLSQGTYGFRPGWGGESGSVSIGQHADFLFAHKIGGGVQETGFTTLGSVFFGGGPFPGSTNSLDHAGNWRVSAGERIGIAFDALDEGSTWGLPPARWYVVTRLFRLDGSLVGEVAAFSSDYGNGSWHRRGVVFNATQDGYLSIEAYVTVQGPPTSQISLLARRFTFARMRSDATELPDFSAPAGGGQMRDISANLKITAEVAADTQTRLGRAIIEMIGGAGGDPFQFLLRAIGSTSIARLVASSLEFCNVVGGQVVEVMKLVGGSVFISGKLLLGAVGQIELDPSIPAIIWKSGGRKLIIGSSLPDNLIAWFGVQSTTVSEMTKGNAAFFLSSDAPGIGGVNLRTNTIQQANLNAWALSPGVNNLMPVNFGYTVNGAAFVITLDITHTGSGGYAASGQVVSANPDGSDEVVLLPFFGVAADGQQGRQIDMKIANSNRNGPRKLFVRLDYSAGPITLNTATFTAIHLG